MPVLEREGVFPNRDNFHVVSLKLPQDENRMALKASGGSCVCACTFALIMMYGFNRRSST